MEITPAQIAELREKQSRLVDAANAHAHTPRTQAKYVGRAEGIQMALETLGVE